LKCALPFCKRSIQQMAKLCLDASTFGNPLGCDPPTHSCSKFLHSYLFHQFLIVQGSPQPNDHVSCTADTVCPWPFLLLHQFPAAFLWLFSTFCLLFFLSQHFSLNSACFDRLKVLSCSGLLPFASNYSKVSFFYYERIFQKDLISHVSRLSFSHLANQLIGKTFLAS